MDEEGNFLTVKCDYDSMDRRVFKKVIRGTGTVTSHHPPPQTLSAIARRACYACLPSLSGNAAEAGCDLTRTNHPALWLITWDPTQPIATRPLAIQKDGTWYTYGLDLTKNVCEVFGATGYIRTAYTYSPYGSVTATGNVTQPIQWSSEVMDEELGLVYYNYRYYNAQNGKWINRDFLNKKNLFVFSANRSIINFDYLGLHEYKAENKLKVTASIQWWDDDGGVSGQDGSQEIGISDEWLASLDMSLIVTCYNGEIKICSKDNDIDKAVTNFYWGSASSSMKININNVGINKIEAEFKSSIYTEGHSEFATIIGSAAGSIGGAIINSKLKIKGLDLSAPIAGLVGAGVGKIMVMPFNAEPTEWSVTAIIECPCKRSEEKPNIVWSKIKPMYIWLRKSAHRGNISGYEHYVPRDRTWLIPR